MHSHVKSPLESNSEKKNAQVRIHIALWVHSTDWMRDYVNTQLYKPIIIDIALNGWTIKAHSGGLMENLMEKL